MVVGSNSMEYRRSGDGSDVGVRLQRLFNTRKASSKTPRLKQRRRVVLRGVDNSQKAMSFISNKIFTSKYNPISFLPKFLFEQFRRYANVFFLSIGLLQQIPDVSPTGRYVTIVPFMTILFLSALRELAEDFRRHQSDDKINKGIALVFDRERGEFVATTWEKVVVGDVLKVSNGMFFPADIVVLASSEPQGMCYVETANLDGETNLKIRSATTLTSDLTNEESLQGVRVVIECEEPNRNLYEFRGTIQRDDSEFEQLSSSTVLLRGAKLMNTKWIHGVVVYTGHETKLLMNSNKAPLKRSNIDRITNYQIVFLFIVLMIISGFSALSKLTLTKDELTYVVKHLPHEQNLEEHQRTVNRTGHFFQDFLTFVLLYNNLIPISLQLTLEFVKFIQVYFVSWDLKMYYEPTDTYAVARTSNLNEELGQVKYVFSDKTGTLTQNVMEYKKAFVAGKKYEIDDEIANSSRPQLIEDLSDPKYDRDAIKDFLILMSVCHTVIPEEQDGQLIYNASSPDERALVQGAAKYGFRFVGRKPESVLIETPFGTVEEYIVLNIIEFTSSRKMMSVVVRCPDNSIKLYTKGADTVIQERLGNGSNDRVYEQDTIEHLEAFAGEGLRTLCLAVRVIGEQDYAKWNAIFYEASLSVDKESEMEKAATLIEKDLTLLGATAIEDKLQDGVPETVDQLLEAYIHVWMLTGDKQETAINIGHSCGLLKEDVSIIIFNTSSLDETRAEINRYLQPFREHDTVGSRNAVSLVVNGKSLLFALKHALRKEFIELCCSCSTVICCRVSPIQKAEMVELVQEHTMSICLAIGDGANDVAMIQKAHVGIGISGHEGLQAANSSDFAICQFRFLSRLLFLHGAWFYTRVSKLILYSFYKNICLYIIELWYAMYNYWTGQVLFERWTIGLYNLFMTAAPPVAIGLFDQHCREETRIKYPKLYRSTQNSEFFNHRVFWRWMANSIMHSVIIYWIPMTIVGDGIVWKNGRNADYLVLGNIVYTCVVITVCLKAGLEIASWNWFCHVAVWGSIGFWFAYLTMYSFFWPIGIPFAADMAGMIVLEVNTPIFWLCCVLVPFVALMPDIVITVVYMTMFPSDADKIRMAEVAGKAPSLFVKTGERNCLGKGKLLRSLRNAISLDCNGGASAIAQKREEHEMGRGYAFSQEEHGIVSQTEYVRRYGTYGLARSRGGGT